MTQQFFEDDWLKFSFQPIPKFPHQKRLEWELSEGLIIPTCSPIASIVGAVKRMDLGKHPVVALSGGVDSQATCLALKEAGIKFTTYTNVFEDGLNAMDAEHAKMFCDKYNIPNTEFKINIMDFLRRKLYDIAIKYECPSPQISSHFYLFEHLIQNTNATSILAGGTPPVFIKGILTFNVTRAQNSWTNFKEKTGFKVYGNFLSHSFDIAAPIIVARKNVVDDPFWYDSKHQTFKNIGLEVIEQADSFTGFEKVKKALEEITNDGWSFEKMFRHPYQRFFEDYVGFLNRSKIEEELLVLNLANNSYK